MPEVVTTQQVTKNPFRTLHKPRPTSEIMFSFRAIWFHDRRDRWADVAFVDSRLIPVGSYGSEKIVALQEAEARKAIHYRRPKYTVPFVRLTEVSFLDVANTFLEMADRTANDDHRDWCQQFISSLGTAGLNAGILGPWASDHSDSWPWQRRVSTVIPKQDPWSCLFSC